jgi:hypothetical protein
MHHKLYSWAYFIFIIVICLVLYKDYGISWDEPVQRGIGYQAVKYVEEGDQLYMQMNDRIYGVAFEIPLIIGERIFKLEDTRDIYFFRHLCNVLFFAYACFIFFRLNLKLFHKVQVALIPTLILLISPRIFGHAFFNSKDIPFLCMYIISFYTLHNYLLKQSYRNLLVLAVCAGLLVNFRIMGILFFFTALFSMVVFVLKKGNWKFLIQPIIFTGVAGLCLYATWPYLWEKPFIYFRKAYELMSKFPWQGSMLFRGHVIHPGEQRAFYLFTWIGITVPFLYLFLSLSGIATFLWMSLKKLTGIFENPQKMMGWVFLVNSIAPIAAVLYLKSILYDDWRQLYFIYPGLIVFSGYLFYQLKGWNPKFVKVSFFVCLVYMGYIGFQMIQLHPYEQVYFNETVPRKKDYIMSHYEEDYWGTSFYEGLTYIAKTDPSDTIKLFLFHDALRRNTLLLPEKDRKRFVFLQTDGEKESKYYLTTFRFDHVDIVGHSHFKEVCYEIKRQNSPILRIWKH